MNFADKVVLITGAGTGIGRELSRALLREGANVVLVGRRSDKLEESIRGASNAHRGIAITADVSKLKDLRSLVEQVVAKFGRIDVVVHNAGIVYAGEVDSVSAAEVEHIMKVNVVSPIWLTQLVLPILKRRPEAMLVYIASIAAFLPVPCQSFYCASKHAVHGFSESVRRELLDSKVKVVTAYPGNVESELMSSSVRAKMAEVSFGKADIMKTERAAEIIVNGMRKESPRVFVTNRAERSIVRVNGLVPSLVDRRMKQMKPKIKQVLGVMTEWSRSRTVLAEPE